MIRTNKNEQRAIERYRKTQKRGVHTAFTTALRTRPWVPAAFPHETKNIAKRGYNGALIDRRHNSTIVLRFTENIERFQGTLLAIERR